MGFESNTGLGTQAHYGERALDQSFGGQVSTSGLTKELSWNFDFDKLPAYAADNMDVVIPAYAKIVSARFEVLTAFTSTSTTSDLLVGAYQATGATSPGTVVDADGFLTAAQLTQTVIATRGNYVVGTGALVGASVGAEPVEVTVAPSVDDLLTGKARLVIEYMDEAPGA